MKRRSFFILSTLFLFTLPAHSQPLSGIATFLKQKGVSPKNTSVYAAWVDTGAPIAVHNENLAVLPASSLKILTSYCALKKLGISHTLSTNFFSDGPIQNGVIGNLFVHGEGDPSLVSERLWLAVQHLKGLGLKKINGNIIIDDSYFDHNDYPGRQENNERAYNAPPSAVSLNFNTVTIQVSHNSEPVLSLFPNIPYFKVNNSLKTGGKTKVMIGSEFKGTHEVINVSGTIQNRNFEKPLSFYRNIQEPSLFFGHALKAQLQESGIAVLGEPKKGLVSGQNHLLLKFESRPLREMVSSMNKFSNNFMAEQLVKYMGAKFNGAPGTTPKGIVVLKQCLQEAGGNVQAVTIENGSGLSYKNRISSGDLVKVLIAGFRDFNIHSEFISSLSAAGLDGTMRSRKIPKELEGILRAKTGSLNGANSLVGFVPNREGKLIAFAILMDNFRGGLWEGHAVQDRLVLEWLKLSQK